MGKGRIISKERRKIIISRGDVMDENEIAIMPDKNYISSVKRLLVKKGNSLAGFNCLLENISTEQLLQLSTLNLKEEEIEADIEKENKSRLEKIILDRFSSAITDLCPLLSEMPVDKLEKFSKLTFPPIKSNIEIAKKLLLQKLNGIFGGFELILPKLSLDDLSTLLKLNCSEEDITKERTRKLRKILTESFHEFIPQTTWMETSYSDLEKIYRA